MSLYHVLVSLIFFAFVHKHEKAICKKIPNYLKVYPTRSLQLN